MYDTIIVGGGAAGLFAAANLKGNNNLLLEGSKKLGQKILITGGGMCNITNCDETEDFINRFGDKKKANFLKPALMNLSTQKTKEWLTAIGLELTTRDDGKVFPASLKAQSLIDTLQREASKNSLFIKYNSKVIVIKHVKNHFLIETTNDKFECNNLIIATGGKSFPDTGSDGAAYNLIKKLGHKINTPTPSLTSIKVSNYPFKALSGSSVKGSSIDFFRNGEQKRYFHATGDILFPHQGLSGPGILNNSRIIRDNDELSISLVPCNNKENLRSSLLSNFASSGKKTLKRVLKEIGLTSSMATELLNHLNIKEDETAKQLNKKIKKRIINHLINFPIKVKTKTGFNAAMATAGGVDISEIDRKTMQSKIIPKLFFAGEVIDIDGDTGGYNIQAAFSTAKLIVNKIN